MNNYKRVNSISVVSPLCQRVFQIPLLVTVTFVALYGVSSAVPGAAASLVTLPCPLPDTIPKGEPRSALEATERSLRGEANSIEERLRPYNNQCRWVKAGSPDEAACITIREPLSKEWKAYEERRENYKRALLAAVDDEIAMLGARLITTRAALGRVPSTSAQWEKEIEDWIDFSEVTRREVRNKALGIAAGMVLDKFKKSKDQARMLAEEELVFARHRWLDVANKFTFPRREEALARLNSVKTDQEFLEFLKWSKQYADQFYNAWGVAIDPNWQSYTNYILELLKLTQSVFYSNPFTTLLITDLEAASNAIYGWWAILAARGQLETLAVLEDRYLRDVDRLSRMYIDDTRKRPELLKARLQVEKGC